MTRAAVVALADQTSDAYSADRYGPAGWRAAVRGLAAEGFTDREIEAILRSKWARWAADQVEGNGLARYGRIPGRVLVAYAVRQPRAEVAELVAGTFGA